MLACIPREIYDRGTREECSIQCIRVLIARVTGVSIYRTARGNLFGWNWSEILNVCGCLMREVYSRKGGKANFFSTPLQFKSFKREQGGQKELG